MKKLRLNVEALRVETFEPAEERGGRGTVLAFNTQGQYTCVYHCTFRGVTCEGDLTCGCQNTLNCTPGLSDELC